MKIFVHIGMHKTGSTSIQHFFCSQRDQLNDLLVEYPRTKNNLIHHDDLLNLRFESTKKLKSILQRISGSEIKKVILSAEAVSVLNEQETLQLHNCLLQFGDVTYILILRDWSGYLPSRYQQNCKRRDTQTFSEFINSLVNHDTPHHDLYYEIIIEKYLNLNAQLKIISYDNAIQEDRLIQEFCDALELDIIVSLESQNKFNQRWGTLRTEITRITNGLLAQHFKVPQNELFNSISKQKKFNRAFDLDFNNRSYDNDLRPIEELIKESIRFYKKLPIQISSQYETLTKKYFDLVINPKGGQIFDNHSISNLQVGYSDMTWDTFGLNHPTESEFLLQLSLKTIQSKSISARPWKSLNPYRKLFNI